MVHVPQTQLANQIEQVLEVVLVVRERQNQVDDIEPAGLVQLEVAGYEHDGLLFLCDLVYDLLNNLLVFLRINGKLFVVRAEQVLPILNEGIRDQIEHILLQ